MATATSKCIICHRKALLGDKYCVHHKQAFENMINHYKAWINAYGRVSWEEFLIRLSDMQETGSWVKEVIARELEKSKGKIKEGL
ncbi:MAG TPA: hypothetical protein VHF28_01900 [Nitrososphaera sp.]|jgi:hypothetical protein|nr:hypothetical protein [Nitrososphaera sp.]